jgi:uncharacterized protein (DUF169 family)
MESNHWDPLGWKEVFKKLNLEAPPVGVSFFIKPPEGIHRLDGNMRLCEMLKRSHEGDAFYADPENHTCDAGLYIMGKDVPSVYTTGEYGAGLQIFNHTRVARKIYDFIPKFDPESNISYVAFSPLDKLTFDPDLLVLVAQVDQTEILLRAMSYLTGNNRPLPLLPIHGQWQWHIPALQGSKLQTMKAWSPMTRLLLM